jgi:hypothetical protein
MLLPEQRTKLDQTSDNLFYEMPRLVTHVDGTFIQRLTDLYKERLITWHRAILARGNPLTIFAAAAFHNRVRDGSEWGHSAIGTRKLVELPIT